MLLHRVADPALPNAVLASLPGPALALAPFSLPGLPGPSLAGAVEVRTLEPSSDGCRVALLLRHDCENVNEEWGAAKSMTLGAGAMHPDAAAGGNDVTGAHKCQVDRIEFPFAHRRWNSIAWTRANGSEARAPVAVALTCSFISLAPSLTSLKCSFISFARFFVSASLSAWYNTTRCSVIRLELLLQAMQTRTP